MEGARHETTTTQPWLTTNTNHRALTRRSEMHSSTTVADTAGMRDALEQYFSSTSNSLSTAKQALNGWPQTISSRRGVPVRARAA